MPSTHRRPDKHSVFYDRIFGRLAGGSPFAGVNVADPSSPAAVTPEPAALPALRLAARLALLMAAALLAIWLWSRVCRFPSIPWNDMRLAPTIALAQGWPVYPNAGSGTINTWMYGPLPVLFMWPASWAPTAADALMVAAWLNLALTLVPLAVVCFAWPAPAGATPSRLGRAVALLTCLAIWPELHYSVIFSDNLALACALIGNLVLARAKHARLLWIAAGLATATVACKQIALGIPLAQVVWLGLTAGRTAALRHAGRCVATGAVIGGAAIGIFGWSGLWFTLVEVPGSFGWAPNIAQRLGMVTVALAVHLGLPAAAMLACRRWFAQPTLLLPAVVWLCTLPLGLAGLLKLGGWTNSIHSFVLWLPPVLASALTLSVRERVRWPVLLGAGLFGVAMASGRLMHEPSLALRPLTADYRQAEQLAAQHRGALWFPVHPLVTLYSDRRYYHDEDGLYVRMMARKFPSNEHAASQLPAAMQMMAFRNDWTDWGIARRMLPPNSRETVIGNWTLRSGVAENPR